MLVVQLLVVDTYANHRILSFGFKDKFLVRIVVVFSFHFEANAETKPLGFALETLLPMDENIRTSVMSRINLSRIHVNWSFRTLSRTDST